MTRIHTLIPAIIISLSCLANLVEAQAPAAKPPIAPGAVPATQPAGRSPQAIMEDLNAAGKELQGVLDSPQTLLDPVKRKEIAPKAIGPMKKVLGLFDEMSQLDPRAKAQVAEPRVRFIALLTLMGDADAQAKLTAGQQSKDPHEAVNFQGTALLVRWWQSNADAAVQGKILDDFSTLAKANAQEDVLAPMVAMMSQQGPANAQVKERAESILVDDLKGETAQQISEQVRAERKQRAMENKPFVVTGAQLNGKVFTTAEWKGKVVLIDFWATWCQPCLAELPRVKKIYGDYHAKGLEIIGVSCDQKAEDLTAFLEKNADMPWPQLFDKTKPGWHPLAKDNGVMGIPTMFLVDRKGILRSVEAREKLEELIPKLLEEKP